MDGRTEIVRPTVFVRKSVAKVFFCVPSALQCLRKGISMRFFFGHGCAAIRP